MNAPPLQRHVKLQQLRLLVAIAEHGSLLKAAEALHITQPAATKSLRQLESTVGEPLVSRGNAGSVLTPVGEVLCQHAQRIQSELRDAEEAMGLWHSGGAGHVTLGVLPVAAPMLVPEAIRALAVVAPRITTRVVEGNSESMFRSLKSGSVDLVVGRVWPGEDPELSSEALYESPFRLAVREGHPLANTRRVRLAQALQHPWFLPPTGTHTRTAIDDWFRQSGASTPHIPMETTSYLVLRSLLLSTNAICPVPVEVLHEEVQRGLFRFLKLDIDLKLPPISVVRLLRTNATPAVSQVVEQLRLAGQQARQAYAM